MKKLFLIFNHKLTDRQKQDAICSLNITEFIVLPESLQKLWQNIPAEVEEIEPYLDSLQKWLLSNASKKDYILIQGDFGASYHMIKFAFKHDYIPVYSTTKREAVEVSGNDGNVQMKHLIKHCIYRKYGA